MGMKTDDFISQEIYESKEYNDSVEFAETAPEVCENGKEINILDMQIEPKKQKKVSGLIKRMGYLTAAALSAVVVTHSMVPSDAYASSQNSQSVQQVRKVRDKMMAFDDTGYDEIIDANGGVIVVAKDGKQGAIDHDFKVLVPCVYDIISAPSDRGLFLCASVEDDYYSANLYNGQGKNIKSLGTGVAGYFRTSANMAIIEKMESGYAREYWSLDGKLVYRAPYNFYDEIGDISGFHDGKMLLYRTLASSDSGEFGVMDERGNIVWQKSGNQPAGSNVSESTTQIPAKPKKKNFLQKLWHFILYFEFEEDQVEDPFVDYPNDYYDPGYDDYGCYEDFYYADDYGCYEEDNTYTWDEMNEMFGEGWEQWMVEECYDDSYDDSYNYNYDDSYNRNPVPVNSFAYGYALLRGYKNDKFLYVLMDEAYNQKYRFYPNDLYLTNDMKLANHTDNTFTYGGITKLYLHDGSDYVNYGTKLVLELSQVDEDGVVDTTKNYSVLLDFSRNGNLALEEINPNILLAVHDEIEISDETWWFFRDQMNGVQFYGYMDHDGKVVKGYDKATEFTNGQALVVENGETYMIDEKFKVIKSYGETDTIGKIGDLLYIYQNGHQYIVNL